jgi:hypothetical protein
MKFRRKLPDKRHRRLIKHDSAKLKPKRVCFLTLKISARDIQVFVAGAFSITGFHSLCWLMVYLFSAGNGALIFEHIVLSLLLVLGIGIFIGNELAALIAVIYLSLLVIGGFIAMIIYCFRFQPKAMHIFEITWPGLLANVILLGLMIWSGSPRFRK